MKNRYFRIAALLMLFVSAFANAVEELYPFENDSQRKRFAVFIEEVRCPTCKSQNLRGSDATIAEDMKSEIHRMILAGKTDDEIKSFIVNAYGDFALYRPQVKSSNMLLWVAPFIFLLIGAFVFIKIIKNQKPLDNDGETS